MRPPAPRVALAVTLAALAAAAPRDARAGGFEFPDNGAEALGRGAAFTAKADDGTALTYNVAGFARQRGTRLYLGGNLSIQDYEFQRAGNYPDDPNDPATPWGGEPFPRVRNTAGPFFAPFFALSTDFGYFDRLTLVVGAHGPSTIGNRTFPLGVSPGWPSPSRYDFIQSRSSIIFPTAALAYRLTSWLDLGAGVQYVLGNFDQTSVSFTDLGRGSAGSPGPCPNVEYERCDGRSVVRTSDAKIGGVFGFLLRPSSGFALGASVRLPVTFVADGQVTPTPPKAAPIETAPGAARLEIAIPAYFRVGARVVFMDKQFEQGDIEVDGTYETWGSAQGAGPRVSIPELGPLKDIQTTILHKYNDTFSVRAGGAYNFEELGGVIALRAGGYFDASATEAPYTRLDFDTLAKVGGTLGVGYKVGGVSLNLGYAFIFSLPRKVTNGLIRPTNPQQKGEGLDAEGEALPAVNEGDYAGSTHLLSFGVQVVTDELFGFGKGRKVDGLADYEAQPFGPPGAEPPKKDKEESEEPATASPKKPGDADEAAEKALARPAPPPPAADPPPPANADAEAEEAPAPRPKPAKKPAPRKKPRPKKRPTRTDMEL